MIRCKLAVGLLSGRYSQQPKVVAMETDNSDHTRQKVFLCEFMNDPYFEMTS